MSTQGKLGKDAASAVCWPIGDPVDLQSVHKRARTPPSAAPCAHDEMMRT
jgi:hypothetical protein